LVHGSAGRSSNRAQPQRVRAKVLRLIRRSIRAKLANVSGRRWR
jgi:hypothetical protein